MDITTVFGTVVPGSSPGGSTIHEVGNWARYTGRQYLYMANLTPKEKKQLLSVARKYGTPLYVYDAAVLMDQCARLKRHFPEASFHYAIKANANPEILKVIKKAGFGVEAVSAGELELALSCGFAPAQISFTCSNLSETELVAIAKTRVRIHLDSLAQLEVWGRRKLGTEVSLRLNQGIGAGHHAHVITGGPDSKFGISIRDRREVLKLTQKYNLTVTGLQQHIGSNVLEVRTLEKAAKALLSTAESFESVTRLDFGGGFGVPYAPGATQLPLAELGRRIRVLVREYKQSTGRELTYSFEPGRFLVAEAGSLLVSVTDMKQTEKHLFVGVNSGFNQLLRPALYDAYHPIENCSRARGPRKVVTIAGNVCESGDIFARKRRMVLPQIGDVLCIRIAGAYGFSMASTYNLRKLPKEVLVQGNKTKDISFSPHERAR